MRVVALFHCSFCPSGPVVYVLDLADRLISKAGPFAAAGIMVGSIYWTAVTYGAVTVMQVQPAISLLRAVRQLHTERCAHCHVKCKPSTSLPSSCLTLRPVFEKAFHISGGTLFRRCLF